MPVADRTSDVLQTQYFGFDCAKMKGFFIKCSGLSSENSVIEEKRVSNGNQEIVFKQPGRLSWGEMTLERGITPNMDMWTWRAEVTSGQVGSARVNCTLTLYSMAGEPAASWEIINAWPKSVDGPSFKSDDDSVGVESIVLVYEAFKRLT